MKPGRTHARLVPWLLLPAMALYLSFSAYPVIRGALISLEDYKLDSLRRPAWAGLSNYRRLFRDPEAGRDALISIRYTLMIVPAAVLLSFACALSLHKLGRAARWFRPVVLLPMVVAGPIIGSIWYSIFDGSRGLFNWALASLGMADPPQWLGARLALFSVAMAHTWGSVAFGTLLYTVALDGIPEQLYEAAAVDGAGPLARTRHITLPGVSKTTGVILMLVMLGAMRDFQYPFIITNGGPAGATQTYTYLIYRTAFLTSPMDLGYGSAMSFVYAVGLLAVSLVVLRVSRRAALP